METKTVFNDAQLYLLQVLSQINDENELQEFKMMVSEWYAKKAQEEFDRLWQTGAINEQTMNGWLNEHMRTPYKKL